MADDNLSTHSYTYSGNAEPPPKSLALPKKEYFDPPRWYHGTVIEASEPTIDDDTGLSFSKESDESHVLMCVSDLLGVHVGVIIHSDDAPHVGDDVCFEIYGARDPYSISGLGVSTRDMSSAPPQNICSWFKCVGLSATSCNSFNAHVCVNKLVDVWVTRKISIYGVQSPSLDSLDGAERTTAIQAKNTLNSIVKGNILSIQIHEVTNDGVLADVFVDEMSVGDHIALMGLASFNEAGVY